MTTREGLIGRIIEAMGLDLEHSTPKLTPCNKAPLVKDVDGDPFSESFAHARLLGCSYTCLDTLVLIYHTV